MARPPRPENSSPFFAGDMPVDPAALQDPEFQAHANALLQPYGLSVPTSAPQNVFLPQTGFFGRHPGLASGIENAVFAAANTPTSETGGDVIPNILKGFLGGRAQRGQMLTAGYQAPFHMAAQLEQLRDNQQKFQLNEAQIQHYRALAAHEGNQDDAAMARINATRPVVYQGGYLGYDPTGNNGQGGWIDHPDPNIRKAAQREAAGGLVGEMIEAQIGPRPTDPTKAVAWGKKAQKIYNNVMGGVAGARAGATDWVHLHDDTAQTQTDKQTAAAAKARATFIGAKSKDFAFLAMQGIDPQDKNLGNKIGAWYDANVAPALDSPMGAGGAAPAPSSDPLMDLVNAYQAHRAGQTAASPGGAPHFAPTGQNPTPNIPSHLTSEHPNYWGAAISPLPYLMGPARQYYSGLEDLGAAGVNKAKRALTGLEQFFNPQTQ